MMVFELEFLAALPFDVRKAFGAANQSVEATTAEG
jgi:hypothetical protein